MPEQTSLEPIVPTARYKKSPEEALAMAETDVGMAAMKNRPMLAARLAKLLEEPKTAEFGTSPQYDEKGRAYVVNKAGEVKYLPDIKKPAEQASPTTLARLYDERSKLLPGDPRIALYDKAIQSEVGSKTPTTNIINPKDTFKLEADLRGEFKDATKDFRTVRDAYQKIENALETGAGDIAVVYAFAKLNDPTSVVRESEFETVARAGSLPQRVQNFANLALEGKMNPQLRENLRQQARAMYLAKQQEANRSMSEFTGLAESYGLNPSRVLGGIDITPVGGKKEKSWTPELEKELRDLERKLLNQGAIKP